MEGGKQAGGNKWAELFFFFKALLFSRLAARSDYEVDVQPPTEAISLGRLSRGKQS
jgi:hypothetical protein